MYLPHVAAETTREPRGRVMVVFIVCTLVLAVGKKTVDKTTKQIQLLAKAVCNHGNYYFACREQQEILGLLVFTVEEEGLEIQ